MKFRHTSAVLFAVACSLVACDASDAATSEDDAAAPLATDAAQPEVSATVESAEVKLGEKIVVKVKVTNTGDEPMDVTVPRLGRHSVTIRVRAGDAEPSWLDRLHADLDPNTGRLEWKMPPIAQVEPGDSLERDVPTIAMQAGAHRLSVKYSWKSGKSLVLDPIDVEVLPDGDKSVVGARLETTHGELLLRLRPDLAYNTTESFASLVDSGFYEGVPFHRIVKGFMAQGGDPTGTGGGGPGYFLPLEAHSKLLHRRGVLSMARTSIPDTAGSQFFLMFERNGSLDPAPPRNPGYTVFGELEKGSETLEALEAVETRVDPKQRAQLEERGYSARQIREFINAGQLEKSQPTETVEIVTAELVLLE